MMEEYPPHLNPPSSSRESTSVWLDSLANGCRQGERECTSLGIEQHHQWMDVALTVAQKALPEDVPVGALLVFQNEVIAQACNRRERDMNPVGHAEILVLQAAAQRLQRWRLTDTILYVTLEPCPMCAAAIQQARVAQVIFGAYDPLLGAAGSRYDLLAPSVETLGGIQEHACQDLLKQFFKNRR